MSGAKPSVKIKNHPGKEIDPLWAVKGYILYCPSVER